MALEVNCYIDLNCSLLVCWGPLLRFRRSCGSPGASMNLSLRFLLQLQEGRQRDWKCSLSPLENSAYNFALLPAWQNISRGADLRLPYYIPMDEARLRHRTKVETHLNASTPSTLVE
jgi:hypothetical protein